MIVFDLRCPSNHVFEAWFGSTAAYEEQRAAGMVACPMCGATGIDKAVMAPNVAPKGNRAPSPPARQDAQPPARQDAPPPEAVKTALAALAKAQARALEGSEWVGVAFADRARAMHLGEMPERPVHGQATLADARALADEGVPIAPLPFPVVPPETRN